MDFVKRYIYPSDYPNLILVNKEFYSIFKYSSPYVQLSNLLYKGGWFSIYTHNILHKMKFTEEEICDMIMTKCAKWEINQKKNKKIKNPLIELFRLLSVN